MSLGKALEVWAIAAVAGLGAPLSAAALPIAPGYSVSGVVTPGIATGDVVAASGALFVGVGSFGVASQSVVRIDAGGATVLAQGFNSLAGFAYDPVSQRLVVGDNGGDLPGALTGDTVYALVDPFGSPAVPAVAADLELLPSGSVPGVADIVFDPSDPLGDRLFVHDASQFFPPNGRLLELTLSSATTNIVQTGLAFAAGLATGPTRLFLGEALLDFSGQVSEVPLAGPTLPRSVLASGLPGQFDLEWASDGTLLATAGGSVLRIDPATGAVQTVASGFGFATGLFEADGIVYVLDGFAAPGEENRIWVLTPVPEAGSALAMGATALALCGYATRRRCGALRFPDRRAGRRGGAPPR